jgi:GNAT superfamily N-acetyltransferase
MAASDFEIGVLAPDELGDADALVKEAGWNQTEADWRTFLDFGTVFAIRDQSAGGKVIATAATLPHGGKFAWISMVLIAGTYRRQGLGTKLMQRCLEDLVAKNLTPVLDATPAGRDVYLGLGFQDSFGYKRLLLDKGKVVPALEREIPVEAISDTSWPELCAYDAAIFGADRSSVLNRLRGRLPEAEFCVWRGGHIAGFLMGRMGRRAAQLGPLVAENEEIACALLAQALETVSTPVYIDFIDDKPLTARFLATAGFVAERPLTRMLLKRSTSFQDVTQSYAVMGPEFG